VLEHDGRTDIFYDDDREHKIVKNQWLVHFTKEENIQDILENGFQYGVDNPDHLGWTGYYLNKTGEKNKKRDSVYVFSYKAKEIGVIKLDAAILFRSNGIEVYSNFDIDEQVISHSKDARNLVGIYKRHNSEWSKETGRYIGGKVTFHIYRKDQKVKLPKFKSIEECIDWVIKNYEQYKNVISFR
jgi:hypothetical protein